jgi:hypothetical protein
MTADLAEEQTAAQLATERLEAEQVYQSPHVLFTVLTSIEPHVAM